MPFFYEALSASQVLESYCDFSRQYSPNPSPDVSQDGTPVPAYCGSGVDMFILKLGALTSWTTGRMIHSLLSAFLWPFQWETGSVRVHHIRLWHTR